MEAFLASVAVHVHLIVFPHILQRCYASLETDGRLFNSSTTTCGRSVALGRFVPRITLFPITTPGPNAD